MGFIAGDDHDSTWRRRRTAQGKKARIAVTGCVISGGGDHDILDTVDSSRRTISRLLWIVNVEHDKGDSSCVKRSANATRTITERIKRGPARVLPRLCTVNPWGLINAKVP